jgi:GNAT superfamily N-acetyltransferase
VIISPRTASLDGQDTLVASWRALARQSTGAIVTTTPRVVAAQFPKWAPLNNAILLADPSSQSAAAAAAELAALYRPADITTWAMWLPASTTNLTDPDQVMEVEGMRRDTTTLVMTRELTHGPMPARGVVRTSIDAATRAGDDPILASELSRPITETDLEAWVIIREGMAVAGGWSFVHGTDCGIYAVSTAPSWRRRGLARALMRGMLDAAYRRGARTASLQSTLMGEPLYRSLGFEPVGRYEEWVPA